MKLFASIPAVVAFVLIFSCTSAFGQKRKNRKPVIKPLVTVSGSKSAKSVPLTIEKKRRQDAFTKAWETLNENYFDKTFNGLDWNKVRAEYQPRVAAAKTDQAVHKIIEEMMGRLDRSHFGLIPPEYFENLKTAKAAARKRERMLDAGRSPAVGEKSGLPADDGSGDEDDAPDDDDKAKFGIGVEIRLIDNRFVITTVEKQSGASIAGLKPGFVIDKINGIPLSDLVSRIISANTNIRHIRRYMPTQIVSLFLNGQKDTSVFLTCLDESDAAKDFKVPRLQLSGETITIGERFPEQFLRFQTLSLNDNVGYIKFNVFALPVIEKFCAALSEFSNKKAIVVDLRGNLGGLLATLTGLTGMLTDHPVIIGTSQYRMGSEVLMVQPKVKNYQGRVVLLVDDQSMSAAELFSAGLQESGRVLVVGERTAGEALPAVTTSLATGAVLVYPIANFKTASGKYLEGSGVEPNFTVALNRKSLLEGKDTQIEKALALVKNDAEFDKPGLGGGKDLTTRISGDPQPPPPKAAPPRAPRDSGISAAPANSLSASSPKVVIDSAANMPPDKDDKAVQAIADFASAVGGLDAWSKFGSYEAVGRSLVGLRGSETEFKFHAYREAPNKYASILSSDALGELRQVYNGKSSFVQSDYGVDTQLFPGLDTSSTQLFEMVSNTINPTYFKTIHYGGDSTIDGHKVTMLYGTAVNGRSIGLTFDAVTRMLYRVATQDGVYTLGDYRKVEGGPMLPFLIEIDRIMNVRLDSVIINPKIEPAVFEKKERCFDKPLPVVTKQDLKN